MPSPDPFSLDLLRTYLLVAQPFSFWECSAFSRDGT